MAIEVTVVAVGPEVWAGSIATLPKAVDVAVEDGCVASDAGTEAGPAGPVDVEADSAVATAQPVELAGVVPAGPRNAAEAAPTAVSPTSRSARRAWRSTAAP